MCEIKFKTPYPKQVEFFKAQNKYIAYGGARGGGKSWAARVKASLLALNYDGIQILLLRRTLGELRENHTVPLKRMLANVATYKEQGKEFLFPNESRIVLGYCDAENDVLHFQGQAYDVIFMEEATQFTEFQFSCLTESNRSSGMCKQKFNPRMYFTCNPGGVGHNWVKRLFIDRDYKKSEQPKDYFFVKSLVYDNKFLLQNSPDYVRVLENLPENRKKAMLYGDWDVFEGQYFPEFNRDIHVCDPFIIPSHWKWYTCMDYGLDMLAHFWIAVDETGNAYVTNEIYESGLLVSQAVQLIKSRETHRPSYRLAPPDLWNTQSLSGKSTAILFEEYGLPLVKSNNNRVDGWMALKELLKPTVSVEGKKTAKLKIFRCCTNLIRTIPMLQFDEKNCNDVASMPHEPTHAPDALRYFAIGWTAKASASSSFKTNPFASKKSSQKKIGYGERIKIW
ncbi:MAG: phage terminase large subunit [Oscillospiraceae bacterium]